MAAAAVLTPAAQPDIQYAPDIEKWHQRTAKRLREENDRLQKTLPEGFPAQLQGSLVWEGKTVGQSYDWTYVLNEEQLAEIDDAVRHFKCKSEAVRSIAPTRLGDDYILKKRH